MKKGLLIVLAFLIGSASMTFATNAKPVEAPSNTSVAQSVKFQIVVIVKDETGATIPGANVVVKGTTYGSITNVDGSAVVYADIGDTLVISFIGYESIEYEITKEIHKLIFILKDDSATLAEVV